MRIFVGEYVCGGGLADQAIDDIPKCLRMEGKAMLRAIVSDLSQVAETVVPLDPRVQVDLDAAKTAIMDPNQPLWACLLYTSPSPRDQRGSRMPSSA